MFHGTNENTEEEQIDDIPDALKEGQAKEEYFAYLKSNSF